MMRRPLFLLEGSLAEPLSSGDEDPQAAGQHQPQQRRSPRKIVGKVAVVAGGLLSMAIAARSWSRSGGGVHVSVSGGRGQALKLPASFEQASGYRRQENTFCQHMQRVQPVLQVDELTCQTRCDTDPNCGAFMIFQNQCVLLANCDQPSNSAVGAYVMMKNSPGPGIGYAPPAAPITDGQPVFREGDLMPEDYHGHHHHHQAPQADLSSEFAPPPPPPLDDAHLHTGAGIFGEGVLVPEGEHLHHHHHGPTGIAPPFDDSDLRQSPPPVHIHVHPFHCEVGVETWTTSWSQQKKDWCCTQYYDGCPDPHTANSPFDCQADIPTWSKSWTADKKAYCCHHYYDGCPDENEFKPPLQVPVHHPHLPAVGAQQPEHPYDCQADVETWERSWEPSKKDYCCNTYYNGCPKTPVYSCGADVLSWRTKWSDDKKEWCCSQYNIGCEDYENLYPKYECQGGTPEAWDQRQSAWCCVLEKRGCKDEMMGVSMDCAATHANFAAAWSEMKKAWCCVNHAVGCPGPPTTTSAFVEPMFTTTTPFKPLFDCEADKDFWQTGWSPDKKNFCCQHDSSKCEAGTTTTPFAILGTTTTPFAPTVLPEMSTTTPFDLSGARGSSGDTTTTPFQILPGQDGHTTTTAFGQVTYNQGGGLEGATTPFPGGITTTEEFDCSSDLFHWMIFWSEEKKGWCCREMSVGCAETTTQAFALNGNGETTTTAFGAVQYAQPAQPQAPPGQSTTTPFPGGFQIPGGGGESTTTAFAHVQWPEPPQIPSGGGESTTTGFGNVQWPSPPQADTTGPGNMQRQQVPAQTTTTPFPGPAGETSTKPYSNVEHAPQERKSFPWPSFPAIHPWNPFTGQAEPASPNPMLAVVGAQGGDTTTTPFSNVRWQGETTTTQFGQVSWEQPQAGSTTTVFPGLDNPSTTKPATVVLGTPPATPPPTPPKDVDDGSPVFVSKNCEEALAFIESDECDPTVLLSSVQRTCPSDHQGNEEACHAWFGGIIGMSQVDRQKQIDRCVTAVRKAAKVDSRIPTTKSSSQEEAQLCFKCEVKCKKKPALRSLQGETSSSDPGAFVADGSRNHCLPKGRDGTASGVQMRVRPEAGSMTKAEWSRLMKALQKMKDSGKIEAYARLYSKALPEDDRIFLNFQQLPWFRRFIFDFETDLQVAAEDCNMMLPYWRACEEASPYGHFSSDLWSSAHLGGQPSCQDGGNQCTSPRVHSGTKCSADSSRWCLEDGIAAGWKIGSSSKDECKCVNRAPGNPSARAMHCAGLEPTMRLSEDFRSLTQNLDAVRATLHCGAAAGKKGTMCHQDATVNDPLFWFSYGFIDRLFFMWQRYHLSLNDIDTTNCYGCEMAMTYYNQPLTDWFGKHDTANECILVPKSNPRACVKYAAAKDPSAVAPPAAASSTTGKAPPSLDDGWDCDAGVNHWREGWSSAKKDWCCVNFNKGCRFDCEAGLELAAEGWSTDKKSWCCKNFRKGCGRRLRAAAAASP